MFVSLCARQLAIALKLFADISNNYLLTIGAVSTPHLTTPPPPYLNNMFPILIWLRIGAFLTLSNRK